MPYNGLFSAHYSNEASMVSDIYIYIIYTPPNILMNTELFFCRRFYKRRACTHHPQGESPNNTTLKPRVHARRAPSSKPLGGNKWPALARAGPWSAAVAAAAPNLRMGKQSRAARDSAGERCQCQCRDRDARTTIRYTGL